HSPASPPFLLFAAFWFTPRPRALPLQPLSWGSTRRGVIAAGSACDGGVGRTLSSKADPAGPGSSEESPAARAEAIRAAPAAWIAEAHPARRPRPAGRARHPVSHQVHGNGAEPGAELLRAT